MTTSSSNTPKSRRSGKCDVDIDKVVREYLVGGKSVREIAKAEDVSYGTIHRRLTAEGVEMRPRGGAH